jgi:hypothetical protein
MAAGYSKSVNLTLGGPIYIPKLINGKNKLFFLHQLWLESRASYRSQCIRDQHGSDGGRPARATFRRCSLSIRNT